MQHAGIAPLQYLRRIRLAAALQSGRNVTQAADMAGSVQTPSCAGAWHLFDEADTPSRMANPIGIRAKTGL